MSDRVSRLSQAVDSLRVFCSDPITEERDIAGILMAFSYSYELAWRCFQDAAVAEGWEPTGPRNAIRNAFRLGLILPDEAEMWKELQDDRNNVAHTYRKFWSEQLVPVIREHYLPLFEKSLVRLQSRRIEGGTSDGSQSGY
jgi:nucleotidyltransferase substrate binding protein (TIGR01987 family)